MHVERWDRVIAVHSIIIGEKKDKTRRAYDKDNYNSKFSLHNDLIFIFNS